jgi:uncharacterized membrane protein YkoI
MLFLKQQWYGPAFRLRHQIERRGKAYMKRPFLAEALGAMLAFAVTVQVHGQTAAPMKSKIPASLKAQAKITPEEARTTATRKVSGVIQEEELEKENGKLVYSYDIKAKGQKGITEVQVSAIDGSIVSIEKEDAGAEATEKSQESANNAKLVVPAPQ